MTKLTYTFSMGGNSIEAGIAAISKRIATLTVDVQKIAVSILRDMKQHGDKPTAAKRANALSVALGNGMRSDSLKAWFETHAPLVWNATEKQLVPGSTAASPVRDHTLIDVEKCIADPWQDAIKVPEYKAIGDWTAQLQALIKKAKTDLKEMGTKSKVDLAQLAVLEGMADHRPLSEIIGVVNVLDTLKADVKAADPLALATV